MQVIAKRTLQLFWSKHHASRLPLTVWYKKATAAKWQSSADIKAEFGGTVDFVGDNRIIFDIGGNKYRLIVHVSYTYKTVMIKFVGTHATYNKIDPETV
jgi:mRNA interferase HigB